MHLNCSILASAFLLWIYVSLHYILNAAGSHPIYKYIDLCSQIIIYILLQK